MGIAFAIAALVPAFILRLKQYFYHVVKYIINFFNASGFPFIFFVHNPQIFVAFLFRNSYKNYREHNNCLKEKVQLIQYTAANLF